MKKNITVITITVILLFFAIFIVTRYQQVKTVDINAYVITSNKLLKNLKSDDSEKKDVDYQEVEATDYIYKNSLAYYVGEETKTRVDLDFPLISKDSDELLVMSEEAKYIDEFFHKTEAYQNSYFANGYLYNGTSFDRVDNSRYLFVELKNGLFTSLTPIMCGETIIPTNSLIYFDKDSIRYYSVENGQFIFHEITGVDRTMIFIYYEKEIAYEKLLDKLNLDLLRDKEQGKESEPIEIIEEVQEIEYDEPENTENVVESKKPVVSFDLTDVTAYLVKGNLKIQDKDGLISRGITFEFRQNGKIFLRKVFYNPGLIEIDGLLPGNTYDVTAYFIYTNERNREMKKTFYDEKITMQGIENIGTVNFAFSDIDVTSNSFTINKFSISNDANDEIIKGIKKITFVYNGKEYQMSSDLIQYVKNKENVIYKGVASLNSNTEYEVKIKAYDVADNELNTTNNTFQIHTAKEQPFAITKISSVGVDRVQISVVLQNKDNINVINKKYVIYSSDKVMLFEGGLDDLSTFEVTGLDTNKVYNIAIFGDYDLDDGKGIVHEGKLGETSFITNSLSSLGYARVNLTQKDKTSSSISYDVEFDTTTTNEQLREIITNFQIKIIDDDTYKVAYEKIIQGSELNDLRNNLAVNFEALGLYSNTIYNIEVITNVDLADSSYQIPTIINVDKFKTYKKDAKVDIINRYVNDNLIDFDVRIYDVDHAIVSDDVFMEVRNSMGGLIYFDYLDINTDYKRIVLNKLDKDEKYTFKYTVEEYNIGDTNETFVNWKVLSEEVIETKTGIYGVIELDSLLNQITNVNLFDLNNENRWKIAGSGGKHYYYTEKMEQVLRLGVKNGERVFSYYLPENVDQDVTISFQGMYGNENHKPIYIFVGDNSNTQNKILLENLSDTYNNYSFTFHLDSPYISFYIQEENGENNVTYLVLKNMQIEEGVKATPYKPYVSKSKLKATYNVTINDSRGEITEKKFYVRMINVDTEESSAVFDMNDNGLTDFTSSYDVIPNTTYSFKLSVKVHNRYYDLDSLDFDTNEEIRSIKSREEFNNIHVNGNYLVVTDLDFRGKKITPGQYGFNFNGKIDFQGHKVYRNMKNAEKYMFYTLGSTSVIKNLDLHYYLDASSSIKDYGGVCNYAMGYVQNLKITIEESNNVAHYGVSFFTKNNHGTIENFVVHTKVSPRFIYTSGLLADENRGNILNGYAYGEDIDATTVLEDDRTNKQIGVISARNCCGAAISNVYSLIGVKVSANASDSERLVGSLIGTSSNVQIRNAIFYASGENRLTTGDPCAANSDSSVTGSNIYYFGDTIYENATISQKMSKLALYEPFFYNQIINTTYHFNVDDVVKYGYYPHIIWPDNMPNQEYIALPKVDNEDLVDIIAISEVHYEGAKTIIKMIINNPNLEKVSHIGIYQIEGVNITKQEDFKGRSHLTIELTNPIRYASTYYVKSITTIGAAGDFTINYEDGERMINVDMYRPVYSVYDYMDIPNHPTENFILMNDLDLSNVPDPQLGTFSGKLNGNYHTIKNIYITGAEKGSFIHELIDGTIVNLYIENYIRDNTISDYSHGLENSGVIGKAQNSYIDNVHVKNVQTTALRRTGGLFGTARNSSISNCSVSGFSVVRTSSEGTDDIFIGGLVGSLVSTDITNSFAVDIDIDARNTIFTYALGGLIGNNDGGKLFSVYAEGRIQTAHQTVGGLIGNNDNGSVDSSYSKVDIISNQDYAGGLTGAGVNLLHSLYVGDLYSSAEYDLSGKTTHFRRISGDSTANSELYAWEGQYINGKISGINNGETLLSTEDLKLHLVYETIIEMGSEFDYSEVDEGILPKLKNSNTGELLPNQPDLKFEKVGLDVNDIRIVKSNERIEQLTVILYNPDHLEVTGLEIQDMRINEIQAIVNDGDYTDVTLVATPQKYYDSYPITGIKYMLNGREKTKSVYTKIDAIFYKPIASATDWNTKIDKDSFENYVITNDIDFTDVPITNVSLKVNRIIGLGDGKKISGIRYTFPKGGTGIIEILVKEMSNIQVDDLIISTTSSQQYFGFIKFSNGILSNIKVTNTQITAKNLRYCGFIAYSKTEDFRNIELDNVYVKGKNTVGGFISAVSRYGDGSHVSLHKVTIESSGSYAGAFCGSCSSGSSITWFHFDADDIEVNGNGSYVGGIFGGSGSAQNVNANNVRVTANGELSGGVFAKGYAFEKIALSNSTITTKSGNNIGVISGFNGGSNLISYNNVLNATNSASKCVGGIIGQASWGITCKYISVIDTQIISAGNEVGGFIGCSTASLTVNYLNIQNSTVSGNDYVGGFLGKKTDSEGFSLYGFSINANVSGNDYVGGVTGYYSNKNTTSSVATRYTSTGMILNSNISGNRYVGGLFGRVDKLLLPGKTKTIYVDADVSGAEIVGSVIGNGDTYANYDINGYGIDGLKVYGNSNLVVGENTYKVSDNSTGLSSSLIASIDDIRSQSTYTNIGFTSSVYDFDELSNDMYPRMSHSVFASSIYTEDFLPKYVPISTKEVTNGMSANTRKFVPLPSVIAYTSDVDKINIEFSSIPYGTTFTIFDYKYQLSQRVYTFTYDFLTDFDVVVSNGYSSKMYSFKAEDLRNNVYLNDNNYYVIDDGVVETDNNSLRQMLNNGGNYQVRKLSSASKISQNIENAINIYNDKVLLNDNQVYDLNSKNIVATSNENFVLVDTVPLYRFTYSNSTIETYYNFSKIDDLILPKQIYVKNDMMEIIDSSLNNKKNQIIIDEYNGKSSIVYLGNDKKLHSMKSPIKYPDNFINQKIKEISSNVLYDTTAILVLYENGNYVLFDYKTGEIIKEKKDYKESVSDYIKSYLSGEYEKGIKKDEKYDDANKLINKLYDKSSINALYTLNKSNSSYYTSVYNPVNEDYDIIELPLKDSSAESLNKLLNNDTINGQINNNVVLSAYYNTNSRKISLGIFVIIVVVIALIMSLLLSLKISMRNKKCLVK